MTLSGGNLTKCATSRRKILSLRQLEMYTVFHKTTPYLIAHNFGKVDGFSKLFHLLTQQ